MKLLIQNMVSRRCNMVVQSQLEKLGIGFHSIELGEVQLAKRFSARSRHCLIPWFVSLQYTRATFQDLTI